MVSERDVVMSSGMQRRGRLVALRSVGRVGVRGMSVRMGRCSGARRIGRESRGGLVPHGRPRGMSSSSCRRRGGGGRHDPAGVAGDGQPCSSSGPAPKAQRCSAVSSVLSATSEVELPSAARAEPGVVVLARVHADSSEITHRYNQSRLKAQQSSFCTIAAMSTSIY